MSSAPDSPPSAFVRWIGPFALAAIVAVLAGLQLWFLCDDAFINYRFCGNAYDGHGFVWNAAPFLPVEGYTSPAWVFGLYLVWVATGIEPPDASTAITFFCGLLTLWFVARRLAAVVFPEGHRRWQPLVTALTLLAIAGNHTFATWLSSGMETSVFALFGILWTLRATRRDGIDGAGIWLLGSHAAIAYLIRPDGILLVLGTLAIAVHAVLTRRRGFAAAAAALATAAVPAAHFLWRHAYYGEWLPNTYYAKVTAAWPESGVHYLYCYALEHGLWLWFPLVISWLLFAACRRGGISSLFGDRFASLTAVGAWLGFAGYYSFVVGGDHFAWRIFLQFVPMMFWATVAMAASLRLPALVTAFGVGLLGVVADVPGWWLEAQLVGRETEGFARTATRGPAVLRPILASYDRHQAWLYLHSVGFRRAFHAEMCRLARLALPERRPGQVEGAEPGQRLVYRADAIGVNGWALSDVAILDGHGLCDYVIARTRKEPDRVPKAVEIRSAFTVFDLDGDELLEAREIEAGAQWWRIIGPQARDDIWPELLLSLGDLDRDECLDVEELVAAVLEVLPARQMAHERSPPVGYIRAFHPNVERRDGRLVVLPDVAPLSDEEIRAVEREWRARVAR